MAKKGNSANRPEVEVGIKLRLLTDDIRAELRQFRSYYLEMVSMAENYALFNKRAPSPDVKAAQTTRAMQADTLKKAETVLANTLQKASQSIGTLADSLPDLQARVVTDQERSYIHMANEFIKAIKPGITTVTDKKNASMLTAQEALQRRLGLTTAASPVSTIAGAGGAAYTSLAKLIESLPRQMNTSITDAGKLLKGHIVTDFDEIIIDLGPGILQELRNKQTPSNKGDIALSRARIDFNKLAATPDEIASRTTKKIEDTFAPKNESIGAAVGEIISSKKLYEDLASTLNPIWDEMLDQLKAGAVESITVITDVTSAATLQMKKLILAESMARKGMAAGNYKVNFIPTGGRVTQSTDPGFNPEVTKKFINEIYSSYPGASGERLSYVDKAAATSKHATDANVIIDDSLEELARYVKGLKLLESDNALIHNANRVFLVAAKGYNQKYNGMTAQEIVQGYGTVQYYDTSTLKASASYQQVAPDIGKTYQGLQQKLSDQGALPANELERASEFAKELNDTLEKATWTLRTLGESGHYATDSLEPAVKVVQTLLDRVKNVQKVIAAEIKSGGRFDNINEYISRQLHEPSKQLEVNTPISRYDRTPGTSPLTGASTSIMGTAYPYYRKPDPKDVSAVLRQRPNASAIDTLNEQGVKEYLNAFYAELAYGIKYVKLNTPEAVKNYFELPAVKDSTRMAIDTEGVRDSGEGYNTRLLQMAVKGAPVGIIDTHTLTEESAKLLGGLLKDNKRQLVMQNAPYDVPQIVKNIGMQLGVTLEDFVDRIIDTRKQGEVLALLRREKGDITGADYEELIAGKGRGISSLGTQVASTLGMYIDKDAGKRSTTGFKGAPGRIDAGSTFAGSKVEFAHVYAAVDPSVTLALAEKNEHLLEEAQKKGLPGTNVYKDLMSVQSIEIANKFRGFNEMAASYSAVAAYEKQHLAERAGLDPSIPVGSVKKELAISMADKVQNDTDLDMYFDNFRADLNSFYNSLGQTIQKTLLKSVIGDKLVTKKSAPEEDKLFESLASVAATDRSQDSDPYKKDVNAIGQIMSAYKGKNGPFREIIDELTNVFPNDLRKRVAAFAGALSELVLNGTTTIKTQTESGAINHERMLKMIQQPQNARPTMTEGSSQQQQDTIPFILDQRGDGFRQANKLEDLVAYTDLLADSETSFNSALLGLDKSTKESFLARIQQFRKMIPEIIELTTHGIAQSRASDSSISAAGAKLMRESDDLRKRALQLFTQDELTIEMGKKVSPEIQKYIPERKYVVGSIDSIDITLGILRGMLAVKDRQYNEQYASVLDLSKLAQRSMNYENRDPESKEYQDPNGLLISRVSRLAYDNNIKAQQNETSIPKQMKLLQRLPDSVHRKAAPRTALQTVQRLVNFLSNDASDKVDILKTLHDDINAIVDGGMQTVIDNASADEIVYTGSGSSSDVDYGQTRQKMRQFITESQLSDTQRIYQEIEQKALNYASASKGRTDAKLPAVPSIQEISKTLNITGMEGSDNISELLRTLYININAEVQAYDKYREAIYAHLRPLAVDTRNMPEAEKAVAVAAKTAEMEKIKKRASNALKANTASIAANKELLKTGSKTKSPEDIQQDIAYLEKDQLNLVRLVSKSEEEVIEYLKKMITDLTINVSGSIMNAEDAVTRILADVVPQSNINAKSNILGRQIANNMFSAATSEADALQLLKNKSDNAPAGVDKAIQTHLMQARRARDVAALRLYAGNEGVEALRGDRKNPDAAEEMSAVDYTAVMQLQRVMRRESTGYLRVSVGELPNMLSAIKASGQNSSKLKAEATKYIADIESDIEGIDAAISNENNKITRIEAEIAGIKPTAKNKPFIEAKQAESFTTKENVGLLVGHRDTLSYYAAAIQQEVDTIEQSGESARTYYDSDEYKQNQKSSAVFSFGAGRPDSERKRGLTYRDQLKMANKALLIAQQDLVTANFKLQNSSNMTAEERTQTVKSIEAFKKTIAEQIKTIAELQPVARGESITTALNTKPGERALVIEKQFMLSRSNTIAEANLVIKQADSILSQYAGSKDPQHEYEMNEAKLYRAIAFDRKETAVKEMAARGKSGPGIVDPLKEMRKELARFRLFNNVYNTSLKDLPTELRNEITARAEEIRNFADAQKEINTLMDPVKTAAALKRKKVTDFHQAVNIAVEMQSTRNADAYVREMYAAGRNRYEGEYGSEIATDKTSKVYKRQLEEKTRTQSQALNALKNIQTQKMEGKAVSIAPHNDAAILALTGKYLDIDTATTESLQQLIDKFQEAVNTNNQVISELSNKSSKLKDSNNVNNQRVTELENQFTAALNTFKDTEEFKTLPLVEKDQAVATFTTTNEIHKELMQAIEDRDHGRALYRLDTTQKQYNYTRSLIDKFRQKYGTDTKKYTPEQETAYNSYIAKTVEQEKELARLTLITKTAAREKAKIDSLKNKYQTAVVDAVMGISPETMQAMYDAADDLEEAKPTGGFYAARATATKTFIKRAQEKIAAHEDVATVATGVLQAKQAGTDVVVVPNALVASNLVALTGMQFTEIVNLTEQKLSDLIVYQQNIIHDTKEAIGKLSTMPPLKPKAELATATTRAVQTLDAADILEMYKRGMAAYSTKDPDAAIALTAKQFKEQLTASIQTQVKALQAIEQIKKNRGMKLAPLTAVSAHSQAALTTVLSSPIEKIADVDTDDMLIMAAQGFIDSSNKALTEVSQMISQTQNASVTESQRIKALKTKHLEEVRALKNTVSYQVAPMPEQRQMLTNFKATSATYKEWLDAVTVANEEKSHFLIQTSTQQKNAVIKQLDNFLLQEGTDATKYTPDKQAELNNLVAEVSRLDKVIDQRETYTSAKRKNRTAIANLQTQYTKALVKAVTFYDPADMQALFDIGAQLATARGSKKTDLQIRESVAKDYTSQVKAKIQPQQDTVNVLSDVLKAKEAGKPIVSPTNQIALNNAMITTKKDFAVIRELTKAELIALIADHQSILSQANAAIAALSKPVPKLQNEIKTHVADLLKLFSIDYNEEYNRIKGSISNSRELATKMQAFIDQSPVHKELQRAQMVSKGFDAATSSATRTNLQQLQDKVSAERDKAFAIVNEGQAKGLTLREIKGIPEFQQSTKAAKGFQETIHSVNQELGDAASGGTGGGGRGISGSLIRVATTLGSIWFMISRVQWSMQALVLPGIQYAKAIETSGVGLAGILMSMTRINSETLTWGQSLYTAQNIVKRVQDASTLTGVAAEDLQKLVQSIMGAGMMAQMSIDQVVRLGTVGASAIKQLGLPDTQFVQEMRDLVQGGIQVSSSVLATQLGITDSMLNQYRNTGKLFDYLMERMQGFQTSQLAYLDTYEGRMSLVDGLTKRLAAEGLEPLFNSIKNLAKEYIDTISDIDTATGKIKIKPEIRLQIKDFVRDLMTATNNIISMVRAVASIVVKIGDISYIGTIFKTITGNIGAFLATLATATILWKNFLGLGLSVDSKKALTGWVGGMGDSLVKKVAGPAATVAVASTKSTSSSNVEAVTNKLMAAEAAGLAAMSRTDAAINKITRARVEAAEAASIRATAFNAELLAAQKVVENYDIAANNVAKKRPRIAVLSKPTRAPAWEFSDVEDSTEAKKAYDKKINDTLIKNKNSGIAKREAIELPGLLMANEAIMNERTTKDNEKKAAPLVSEFNTAFAAEQEAKKKLDSARNEQAKLVAQTTIQAASQTEKAAVTTGNILKQTQATAVKVGATVKSVFEGVITGLVGAVAGAGTAVVGFLKSISMALLRSIPGMIIGVIAMFAGSQLFEMLQKKFGSDELFKDEPRKITDSITAREAAVDYKRRQNNIPTADYNKEVDVLEQDQNRGLNKEAKRINRIQDAVDQYSGVDRRQLPANVYDDLIKQENEITHATKAYNESVKKSAALVANARNQQKESAVEFEKRIEAEFDKRKDDLEKVFSKGDITKDQYVDQLAAILTKEAQAYQGVLEPIRAITEGKIRTLDESIAGLSAMSYDDSGVAAQQLGKLIEERDKLFASLTGLNANQQQLQSQIDQARKNASTKVEIKAAFLVQDEGTMKGIKSAVQSFWNAQIQNALERSKIAIDIMKDKLEDDKNRHRISLEDYYTKRMALQSQATEAEITASRLRQDLIVKEIKGVMSDITVVLKETLAKLPKVAPTPREKIKPGESFNSDVGAHAGNTMSGVRGDRSPIYDESTDTLKTLDPAFRMAVMQAWEAAIKDPELMRLTGSPNLLNTIKVESTRRGPRFEGDKSNHIPGLAGDFTFEDMEKAFLDNVAARNRLAAIFLEHDLLPAFELTPLEIKNARASGPTIHVSQVGADGHQWSPDTNATRYKRESFVKTVEQTQATQQLLNYDAILERIKGTHTQLKSMGSQYIAMALSIDTITDKNRATLESVLGLWGAAAMNVDEIANAVAANQQYVGESQIQFMARQQELQAKEQLLIQYRNDLEDLAKLLARIKNEAASKAPVHFADITSPELPKDAFKNYILAFKQGGFAVQAAIDQMTSGMSAQMRAGITSFLVDRQSDFTKIAVNVQKGPIEAQEAAIKNLEKMFKALYGADAVDKKVALFVSAMENYKQDIEALAAKEAGNFLKGKTTPTQYVQGLVKSQQTPSLLKEGKDLEKAITVIMTDFNKLSAAKKIEIQEAISRGMEAITAPLVAGAGLIQSQMDTKLFDIKLKSGQIANPNQPTSILQWRQEAAAKKENALATEQLANKLQEYLNIEMEQNTSPDAAAVNRWATMTTQIRQYREQIARLNVETQGIQLGTVIIPLQTATEKLAGEFSDAFMSIIDGTKSVGEAFRNLAYNVCKYILQMILQEAAWKLTSGLLKSFGLGGGNVKTGGSTTGGTTGGGITGGGLPAAATGGLIDGPGTGTSDSILARVSKGEFVVKAASVSTYGEEFMHRLNRGLIMPNTLPKFADGGLVSTSNTGSASFFQANGAEKSIVTSSTGTKSGPAIIMNIQTPNAESFRQSRGQITADMTRALIQGRRNM